MMPYLLFFCLAYAGFLLLYLIPNGLFYWLCWHGRRQAWAAYRIQPDREPDAQQVRMEILNSVHALLYFALSATLIFFLYRNGLTKIYPDFFAMPRGYFLVSLVAMVLIHDGYFYWTHRLLHWKPLFRYVHHVHHRSLAPTPWASYSFHPLEAVIAALNLVIYPLLFPVHPLALGTAFFVQNIYDMFGHAGFDGFPRSFMRHRLLGLHNTPIHHDMHHRLMNGNYGHYFNIWDMGMGTELRQYQELREPEPDDHESQPSTPLPVGQSQANLLKGEAPVRSRSPRSGVLADR
jgi:lathosterol oxidase